MKSMPKAKQLTTIAVKNNKSEHIMRHEIVLQDFNSAIKLEFIVSSVEHSSQHLQ
jgi:predicted permease